MRVTSLEKVGEPLKIHFSINIIKPFLRGGGLGVEYQLFQKSDQTFGKDLQQPKGQVFKMTELQ